MRAIRHKGANPEGREIKGVGRDDNGNIIAICGYWRADGNKMCVPVLRAIRQIKNRTFRYFVRNGAKRAYVCPFPRKNPTTLRTNADSTTRNNLNSLRLCKDVPQRRPKRLGQARG